LRGERRGKKMTSGEKKKIMIVYDNKKRAEQLKLKQELESRKVCDVVDIYTKPKQAIEDLALNKGSFEYDYRAYIVDDNIEYPAPPSTPLPLLPISEEVPALVGDREKEEEVRRVRERAKRKADSLRTIQKNLEAMGFYQFCKQLQQIKPDARIILLTDERGMSAKMKAFGKKKEDFKRMSGFYGMVDYDKWQYAFCTAIEEFRFDVAYITKPIKSYGHVARKINQLLVTGTYQVEKIYWDPKEERKAKSGKAVNKILALDVYKDSRTGRYYSTGNRPSLSLFTMMLRSHEKDISEREHAAQIVKRLREYERDAKRELDKIQKLIRGWEDRFPSIVEDPSAFEVATAALQEEKKEKNRKNDS
jgi:CheY-like chemotaxis protein